MLACWEEGVDRARDLPKVSQDRERGLPRFAYKRLFAEDSPGGERHGVRPCPLAASPAPALLWPAAVQLPAHGSPGSQPITFPET